MPVQPVNEVCRPAKDRDHPSEVLGSAPGCQSVLRQSTRCRGRRGSPGHQHQILPESQRYVSQPRILMAAGEKVDRVSHFEAVARSGGERLVHVRDQSGGRQAGAIRHGNEAASQFLGLRERWHEGT